MINFFIKRILYMIPVLFAVSTAVFFLSHAIPGDPVDIILGEQAMAADRERLTQQLHLDKPVIVQYCYFMDGLIRGDLGRSIFNQKPVTKMLKERYPRTIHLALVAMIFALGLAIPAGIIAALKKDTWVDSGAMFVALFGISMPTFWLGPLLIIVFAIWLGWFPAGGSSIPGSVILPALTLGMVLAAMTSRMTRSSMLDVLKAEYVTTARAKGLSERKVILKHALKNALNPVLTIVGLQVGALLAGAIVTEKIFSWPGVGSLLITAISRRDYPVVQGCVLVIAFTYVIINTVTDCMYKVVDPRVDLD
jgi:peptide/nickel transport system permease protein